MVGKHSWSLLTQPAQSLAWLVMLASVAACSGATSISADADTGAFLNKAIAAAGGEHALADAKVLNWTGEATVFAGDKRIELGVETQVQPFQHALSKTWLRDKGRSSERDLEIDRALGWMTRDGARTPMPAAMVVHEREQYALYGLMTLLPLRDPRARLTLLAPDREGGFGLHVEHPDAPSMDMHFDSHGRLAWTQDSVDDPEGGAAIEQRIDFEGNIVGAGVHWPKELTIRQNGKLYFQLRLRSFEPRDSWTVDGAARK